MSRFRYLQRLALVVITRGEGHYSDDRGRETSLSAGDWILVFPEIGHCYRPDRPGGWDEVYVMFEGQVFDSWRKENILSEDRPTGRLTDLESWLSEFREVMQDESSGPLTRLCSFQKLLAIAMEGENTKTQTSESDPVWFVDACRLLSRPGFTVEQAADDLNMSYETFRRWFRDHSGIPPHRYHRQQLVNLAAKLLDTTDLKSAEIARNLGFYDEAYFSRVFKKVTGRSPREYRTRQESR